MHDFTDVEFAKLPKWARDMVEQLRGKIQMLQLDVQELSTALDIHVEPQPGDVIIDPFAHHDRAPRCFPLGTAIGFKLPGLGAYRVSLRQGEPRVTGPDKHIDKGRWYLDINHTGGNAIYILPNAANSIYLETER